MPRPRDEALAREIARSRGLDPSDLRPLPGGCDNHVFAVGADDAGAVIRFAIDERDADTFGTEEWCLRNAAEAGIPSPRLLGRGEISGVPYLVQSFVRGRSGTAVPPTEAWEHLGAYAARVARLPLTGAPDDLFGRFGRDLPVAWQQHLSYNIGELGPGDPLVGGVYRRDEQPAIRDALEVLADADLTFGLCHGDLAPRNLLQPAVGSAVLIDYGAAFAGPAPWGDLETVYRCHVTGGTPNRSHVEVFARACGIDLHRAVPLLEAMLLLRSLDLVRWARAQRPDLVDRYRSAAQSAVRRFLRDRENVSCRLQTS